MARASEIKNFTIEKAPERRLGVAVGILATLLVLSVLYTAHAISICSHYALLQQNLRQALKESLPLRSLKDKSVLQPILLPDGKDMSPSIKRVMTLGYFIESRRYRRALDVALEVTFPQTKNYDALVSSLEALLNQPKDDGTLAPDEDLSLSRQRSLNERYRIIVGEVLQVMDTTFEGEIDDYRFYEEGLLEGLPVLPNIPDGIHSDKGLRLYLRKTLSVDVAKKRLDSSKEMSALFRKQLLSYEKETSEKAAMVARLAERKKILKLDIEEQFQRALLEVTQPEITQTQKWLYEKAQKVMSRMGKPLPVLIAGLALAGSL